MGKHLNLSLRCRWRVWKLLQNGLIVGKKAEVYPFPLGRCQSESQNS